jgi:hypothetical protein
MFDRDLGAGQGCRRALGSQRASACAQRLSGWRVARSSKDRTREDRDRRENPRRRIRSSSRDGRVLRLSRMRRRSLAARRRRSLRSRANASTASGCIGNMPGTVRVMRRKRIRARYGSRHGNAPRKRATLYRRRSPSRAPCSARSPSASTRPHTRPSSTTARRPRTLRGNDRADPRRNPRRHRG